MINKIIWRKYYTDSCSAKMNVLIATLSNCTLTRRQRYFKTMRRLSFSTEQCLLCFWWLSSVCHVSKRMKFCRVVKQNWSPGFPKTTFECRQCLRLWVGINSCSHNAPNVFNRRQIWRIWRPISRRNVMWPTDCGLWCVHEHRPADTIRHDCSKAAL